MITIGTNKSNNQTGRASVWFLALIFLILTLIYFIINYSSKKTEIAIKQKTEPLLTEIVRGDKKETAMPPSEQAVEKPSEQTKGDKSEPLMVKSIKFIPQSPTVLDNIKVEATTNYQGQGITYEYRWLINQKPIDDLKGDILPKGRFKKHDYISVVISPTMGDKKGYPFLSGTVVIQNSLPSLDMTVASQRLKMNEPIELQLTSSDPDGDKVTFSLEAPMLEGMTINQETGKIVWKPQKQQKGTYLFGASASDPDGAKITKTFELKLE